MLQRHALVFFMVIAIGACADQAAEAPYDGPAIALGVAALDLPGVTNARYNLRIENNSDQVVVDVNLTADDFGDGAGAVSYVAPCDAQDNDNTVFLELLDLYEGAAGATVMDPSTYQNPGVLSQDVTCVANEDRQVSFDIAIVRQANQGFFDVAIEFDQVFCSAKLDCERAPGEPIELLFNNGVRDTTVVLGFSCTADVSGGDTTVQYLDDLVVSCNGGADVITLDPTAGPGNLDLGSATDAVVAGTNPLFGAATYRGTESLGLDKQFWNVALGLDGLANCTLATRGAASSGPLTNSTTPAFTVWPYLDWNVNLTDGAGAVACTSHPVNGAGCPTHGVCTVYTPIQAPVQFAYSFDGATTAQQAPLGSQFNPGLSCRTILESGDGTTDDAYSIDPDGAGIGNPSFQVFCDQTTDGGGWAYVGALGETANLAVGDDLKTDRSTASLLTGAQATGATVANLDFDRFAAWGEGWTVRATSDANNDGGTQLQYTYWRPVTGSGATTTTSVVGGNWASTSIHTDLLYLNRTNTLGAANTTWLAAQACSGCAGMWVFFYRITPVDTGAQCLDASGNTTLGHVPPGAWQDQQPGTDTCAFGMRETPSVVPHDWGNRGGWWIKDVNVPGAP